MAPSNLALFWAGVVAFSILIYIVLDGFDLGVGVLFGMTRDETKRVEMMNTIAPFWDGNETWLVIIATGLFAAFPAVYAVFMSAFYLPILLLLFGIIFRGVAFEFRNRATTMRWLWDWAFFLGSVVVAFVQGAAIGGMMLGIPVVNDQYAGSGFEWLHPFSILTGIGLVLGYTLLGAGWLVRKSDGLVREWAFERIPWLAVGVFVTLGLAFLVSVIIDVEAIAEGNLHGHLWVLVLLFLAALALIGVIASARERRDEWPFFLTIVFFVASYATLGVMFWPYMVPFSLTVADAAAPDASLGFIFYAAIIVLPVIIIYTAVVYYVFRGKRAGSYRSLT
jgi:cytochrome bd ubiquinol oxidase subunit II